MLHVRLKYIKKYKKRLGNILKSNKTKDSKCTQAAGHLKAYFIYCWNQSG